MKESFTHLFFQGEEVEVIEDAHENGFCLYGVGVIDEDKIEGLIANSKKIASTHADQRVLGIFVRGIDIRPISRVIEQYSEFVDYQDLFVCAQGMVKFMNRAYNDRIKEIDKFIKSVDIAGIIESNV